MFNACRYAAWLQVAAGPLTIKSTRACLGRQSELLALLTSGLNAGVPAVRLFGSLSCLSLLGDEGPCSHLHAALLTAPSSGWPAERHVALDCVCMRLRECGVGATAGSFLIAWGAEGLSSAQRPDALMHHTASTVAATCCLTSERLTLHARVAACREYEQRSLSSGSPVARMVLRAGRRCLWHLQRRAVCAGPRLGLPVQRMGGILGRRCRQPGRAPAEPSVRFATVEHGTCPAVCLGGTARRRARGAAGRRPRRCCRGRAAASCCALLVAGQHPPAVAALQPAALGGARAKALPVGALAGLPIGPHAAAEGHGVGGAAPPRCGTEHSCSPPVQQSRGSLALRRGRPAAGWQRRCWCYWCSLDALQWLTALR